MNRTTVNLDTLNRMREEYPDRRVIFKVDSDIVADDGYNWWYASECKASLDSILDGSKEMPYDIKLDDEKWYSKEYDDDIIADILFDHFGHHYENEIDNLFEKLPWEDVIILHISV